MSLSAADVRRRGDQIRRRRTALVAGGAALAVAAVAVPVFAVIGNGDPRSDDDNVADDRTRPALAEGDLLRDADTEYDRDGYSLFRTTETFEGDGQSVSLPCQRAQTSTLGATSSFTRTFDAFANPDRLAPGETPPGNATTDDLVEVIAQFDSPDAARSAYDQFAEWIVDCRVPGADVVKVAPQGRSVVVPAGGDAVVYDIQWGPVPEELDPTGDFAYIGEIGLVLQDDRIAVLKLTGIGQDYNWLPEEGGSPLDRMLPKAAERLLPDAEEDRPSATETIGDDFPLGEGWPATAGDGPGLTGPARDLEPTALQACGTTLPDAPHTDRLLARWTDAEDYRSRQLTTYASAEEAVAAVAEIRELYAGCPEGPTREDGFTPNHEVRDLQLGGESFAVLGWDELDGAASTFGDTLLVVRVGSAVLVVSHAGHSGNPQGREQEKVTEISAESAPVVDAMCAFTEAGC